MRFVTVVGNPRAGSRTLSVAVAAAAEIMQAARLEAGHQVIDLSVLARRLLLPEPSPAIEDAIDQVREADLLLVASPTFKATYTGLLKVFFDRLPHRALDGAAAFPLLVMGAPQHAFAVEVHLRPLLVELGATVPAPGLAVLESDLGNLEAVLRPWAQQIATALRKEEEAASGTWAAGKAAATGTR